MTTVVFHQFLEMIRSASAPTKAVLLLCLLLSLSTCSEGFTLQPLKTVPGVRPSASVALRAEAPSTPEVGKDTESLPEQPKSPAKMRLSQIQAELKDMKIDYSDCFDRESLTKRLLDARDGLVVSTAASDEAEVTKTTTEEEKEEEQQQQTKTTGAPENTSFDRESTLQELRAMRVAELRTECAQRNIRWATMIEKEDLVQALAEAREATAGFSLSGAITPGEVAEVTSDELTAELSSSTGTPLLLDVYATWCGPCKLMAPQLEEAAAELGDTVRVVKIDSDKYPEWSSKLRVGGFPTVVVFDRDGKEQDRIEGAVMKPQLLQLAKSQI